MSEQENKSDDMLNQRIDRMVSTAKNANTMWAEVWQDGINYMFDNQLAGKDRPDGFPAVQDNRIYPAVLHKVASQIARSTRVLAEPVRETDKDNAYDSEVWAGYLTWAYHKSLCMDEVAIDAGLYGGSHGYACRKVAWDAEWLWTDSGWFGAPVSECLPPEHVLIDPHCKKHDLSDARYVIIRYTMNVDDLIALYPNHKEAILNAAGDTDELTMGGTFDGQLLIADKSRDTARPGFFGRIANMLGFGRSAEVAPELSEVEKRDDVILVEECFMRDRTTWVKRTEKKIPKERLEGYEVRDSLSYQNGEPLNDENWPREVVEETTLPRFPNGRFIVRIQGNVILNDKIEHQIYRYSVWPIIIQKNWPAPGTFRGINDVEFPKGMQDAHNLAWSAFLSHVPMEAAPPLLYKDGAFPKDAKYLPKQMWKVNDLESSKWMDVPQVSASLIQALDRTTESVENTMGAYDTRMGVGGPSGRTAEEAIRLDTNAGMRFTIPARYQDIAEIRTLELAAEMAARNLKKEQLVRIMGEDGKVLSQKLTEQDLAVKLDISLSIISKRPHDEAIEKMDASTVLEAAGPVYLPEFLKAYRVKNVDEILRNHEIFGQFIEFLNQVNAHNEAMAQQQGNTNVEPVQETAAA